MSEQKLKVSDLPENEQKELIAEAYSVGLNGFFNKWGVDTLKAKIAEKRAETIPEEQKGENTQETTEETGEEQSNDSTEENGEEQGNDSTEETGDEQENGSTEENTEESTEEKVDEKEENAENDEEVIVAGDGGVHPIPTTEEQTQEPEEEIKEEPKEEPEKLIPGEKIPKKEEPRKVNGICHICGSKVVNGVCTGCGFKKV